MVTKNRWKYFYRFFDGIFYSHLPKKLNFERFQIIVMAKLFFLVFLGGGLGSVIRYGIGSLLAQTSSTFPFATFGVNILGSLLIGVFWAIPAIADKNTYLCLLIVGFCGGFTTFSAFSWENLTLLKQGEVFLFFAYVLLSVSLCLLATWGGYAIGKQL